MHYKIVIELICKGCTYGFFCVCQGKIDAFGMDFAFLNYFYWKKYFDCGENLFSA